MNSTCTFSLQWNSVNRTIRVPVLCVCIIGTIIHSIFWFQLIFSGIIREKTMQWLYAYLIVDILVLFRFFFTFIVRMTSTECELNHIWFFFNCYFEAFIDIYLNSIGAYILLGLNICRYVQIVHRTNFKSNNLIHLMIYLTPLINFLMQIILQWARLDIQIGVTCRIEYINIYVRLFNTIILFILPVCLNIGVIYASICYIHSTVHLQHHVSAREKYHRSLVFQFFIFYIVWFLLWSPNIVASQFTTDVYTIFSVRLLSFIEIALDPFIISALDVRIWNLWQNIWRIIRNRCMIQQRQIQPTHMNPRVISIQS